MLKVVVAMALLLQASQVVAQDHTKRGQETNTNDSEPLLYHDRVGLIPGPAGQVEKLQNNPKAARKGESGKDTGSRVALAASVFQGDKFINDKNSKLHFRLRDRTYVELGTDSSFGVERVRRGPKRDSDRKDETILTFYYGIARVTAVSVEKWVRFYVKHAERILTVEGPADFYLETDPDTRDLSIYVRRGKLTLTSAVRGLSAEIPAGQIREIRKDNTIRPLEPLTTKKWAQLKAQTVIRHNKL